MRCAMHAFCPSKSCGRPINTDGFATPDMPVVCPHCGLQMYYDKKKNDFYVLPSWKVTLLIVVIIAIIAVGIVGYMIYMKIHPQRWMFPL